jgi:5'(3')-deoxyribonucleotidase
VYEVTGRQHRAEDVTAFDFAASLGLTRDEAIIVKRHISHRDGWWSSLPVLPGTQEGVARLREIADVYIVTSPWNSCRTWMHEREDWLKRHLDIPASQLIVTSAKHVCAGDVLVDDKTETCAKWEDEQVAMWQMPDGTTASTFAVQWITPHNRLDEWSGRSTNNWNELIAMVLP